MPPEDPEQPPYAVILSMTEAPHPLAEWTIEAASRRCRAHNPSPYLVFLARYIPCSLFAGYILSRMDHHSWHGDLFIYCFWLYIVFCFSSLAFKSSVGPVGWIARWDKEKLQDLWLAPLTLSDLVTIQTEILEARHEAYKRKWIRLSELAVGIGLAGAFYLCWLFDATALQVVFGWGLLSGGLFCLVRLIERLNKPWRDRIEALLRQALRERRRKYDEILAVALLVLPLAAVGISYVSSFALTGRQKVVLFALGYGALAVALLHKVFRAKKDISRSLKIAEDNLYNKIMADEDLYSRSFHALFESEDE